MWRGGRSSARRRVGRSETLIFSQCFLSSYFTPALADEFKPVDLESRDLDLHVLVKNQTPVKHQ